MMMAINLEQRSPMIMMAASLEQKSLITIAWDQPPRPKVAMVAINVSLALDITFDLLE